MQMNKWTRAVATALALAAAAAVAPAAFAKGSSALTGANLLVLNKKAPTYAALSAATSTVMFDVTGIASFDDQGDANNAVFLVDIGTGSRVVGIGWNVTILADGPSWLSEMRVGLGSSSTNFVNLAVGFGDDNPGTVAYSSGGVIDIVALQLDFQVDADGKLRLEFYESFDDFPDALDGRWVLGALTIQSVPIPEPATYGLMALGLLGVGAAVRRRKACA